MIRLMSLQQDSRTGIYYFRKVIPEKLRPVFDRREFKESLETRSLAEARQRMLAPAARYEQLAKEASAVLAGGWSALGRALVGQWLTDTHRDDRWLRVALACLTAFYHARKLHGLDLAPPRYAFEWTERLEGEDALLRLKASHTRGRMTWQVRLATLKTIPPNELGWLVEQVAANAQRIIEPDYPLFEGVAIAFLNRLYVTGVEAAQPRPQQEGSAPSLIVIEGGRSDGTPVSISDRESGSKVGLTISQAFDAWKSYTKGRPRKPQLVQEWGLAVRRFIAMYGDIDMGEIQAQMVRDYREKLLEIPGRTKKSIKALPLDEQAAIAARDGLETLAPATVNKALSALRSITEHVIDKMSHVRLETNAAKTAKFVEVNDSEEKRLPFDEEDMWAIFRDLAITDTTGISEETLFWIVLLAPLTGCRLEELGTLRPRNVRSEQGMRL